MRLLWSRAGLPCRGEVVVLTSAVARGVASRRISSRANGGGGVDGKVSALLSASDNGPIHHDDKTMTRIASDQATSDKRRFTVAQVKFHGVLALGSEN